MSIESSRVLIHGVDATKSIASFVGTPHGYRISFTDGKINTFNKSDVEIVESEPFDINNHDFSDAANDCNVIFNTPQWVGDDLQIEIKDVTGNSCDAILIKEHAIAVAKHFKLKASDL